MKSAVWRVISTGASQSAFRYSSTVQKAAYINDLIYGSTQSSHRYGAWHEFIRRPFTFDLPTPAWLLRRFNPPRSSRNCLYAALTVRTAAMEAACAFMRERIGKEISATHEPRRLISIDFADAATLRIHSAPDIRDIMHRNDYSASWSFAQNHPVDSICYPSCRDRPGGSNIITFAIATLAKTPTSSEVISFSFDQVHPLVSIAAESACVVDLPAEVYWQEVGPETN